MRLIFKICIGLLSLLLLLILIILYHKVIIIFAIYIMNTISLNALISSIILLVILGALAHIMEYRIKFIITPLIGISLIHFGLTYILQLRCGCTTFFL